MGPEKIPIYYSEQPAFPEQVNSAPERRFTTPWVASNKGLFRVDVSIIGPKPEETEDDYTLAEAETKRMIQAIQNLILALQEELR